MLSVGCWDGTLSFYDITGSEVDAAKKLDFDPCTVSHFPSGTPH